jgi:hypothetical protein
LKKIGIVAIAAVAALVLGFGIRTAVQPANAEVTDSVAIWCAFLAPGIDGDLDDDVDGLDLTAACNGISAAEIALLADAYGDGDELAAADLADIDLDLNQISDEPGTGGILDQILIFAFVDDDGIVTFDVPTGLITTVLVDADGSDSLDGDGDPQTCDAADDLDCDAATEDDGDGVVVARINTGTGVPGEALDVEVSQIDNPDAESVQTLNVVGLPDELDLTLVETTVQTDSSGDCLDDADSSDADQLGLPEATFGIATVFDEEGTPLTRITVDWDSSDPDIADIGDDTSVTVDGGSAGVAAFAVICGTDNTGTVTIEASEPDSGTDRDDEAELTVVGEPDAIALTASPAEIACDGSASSTVTAAVTDADGAPVADGVEVNFSVVALGTANPINVDTSGGSASSQITPLSEAIAGVTVLVTAGDAQASILVDCALPIPTATPPGPVPTPTTGGTITPPETGTGGYLGQDTSGGLSLWTLVALAAGGFALVAGGTLARKVSK